MTPTKLVIRNVGKLSGERPAKVPADIGVFVVDDGTIYPNVN